MRSLSGTLACTRPSSQRTRVGKRYGIDPRDILTELGKRQAVAGQEDWILDASLELARGGQHISPAPPSRTVGGHTLCCRD